MKFSVHLCHTFSVFLLLNYLALNDYRSIHFTYFPR